ncbi:hypothetical protein GCM10010468_61980 [Actinocorallia longicatena]|uniref:Tubulin-like protein n=2 Tax=Actinocorallia longicatena TaxID=111803 RepID=A0ABP6QHF9_9ACTN
MKLYQPVMFVGLGGTGCLIGAEFERRLREEICGPDGTAFQNRRESALRYQLPDCLQFVYADVNQAELDRMPARVVPGAQHIPAAQATAHYVRDLVPQVDTYPEVARNLRLAALPVVQGWLPPKQGEPRVLPLQKGAGQLPTVGRAALFETFRSGINPAIRDLQNAVGNLAGAQAAADLHRLADTGSRINTKAVDVFVAFSIAGGTGAGIFYDYLHLIGKVFQDTQVKPKIYPLVLMPSAFPDGLGGGRAAELNAGRALLDLFRLVDQQNGGDAVRDLRGPDGGPADPDDVSVRYPQDGRVVLKPGVVQTAFLFSRPVGAAPDDLRRSVVSLVMSLVGTELNQSNQGNGEERQSFADSFINSAIERQSTAENGIGNRGVSTALVTSLTTPVEELADIVAGRIIRSGIEELRLPVVGVETNRELIEQFFTLSNIHEIFARRQLDFAEPEPATGAREVMATLNDRMEAMRDALSDLRSALAHDIPDRVSLFHPGDAVNRLLTQVDPLRLQRVLFGHRSLNDVVDKEGAAGLMQRRREPPAPPDGFSEAPPPVPLLKDRVLGTVKVKWAEDEPTACREDQDVWYRWRNRVAWTEPWSTLASKWMRPLEQVEQNLIKLNQALNDLALQDPDQFRERSEILYRSRVGVSYLLPPGGDLEQFYRSVVVRLLDRLDLNPAATPSDLLQALIGGDGWREMYLHTAESTVDRAISEMRERVKAQVKTYIQEDVPGKATLLPKLRDLLSEASGQTIGRLAGDVLDEFRSKLTGLVPANFTPQGTGPMKVLVSYPGSRNPAIAEYLKESVRLPSGKGVTFEFTNSTAESVSVVLFRSSMGITEVREVCDVLRSWSEALQNPRPTDFLPWRQRTGYDFGYLATREEHRIKILHRLLCALWNGDVTVEGSQTSPAGVTITLNEVSMTLDLTPLEEASSWGSLLNAYELWTFSDNDDARREFCTHLMQITPHRLEQGANPPSKLYQVVRELAKEQVGHIDWMLDELNATSRARARQMRSFWAETFPSALDYHFEVPATRDNLRGLEAYTAQRKDGYA